MPKENDYPWAQLYDLESGKRSHLGTRSSPGRPGTSIKKEQRSYMFSAEEIEMIEELAFRLNKTLRLRVTKSQVVAVAVRLLYTRTQEQLTEKTRFNSWGDFAAKVFPPVDNSGK
jgi:hypothetical protein